MTRERFSTGSRWEPLIGCSRAVRTGDALTISATAPLAADGTTTVGTDAYTQAKRCLAIVAGVVVDAGFTLEDVVKTRVYFRAREDVDAIARAHGEAFGAVRPANAFVQVVGFADPAWHVEIEAECLRVPERA